MTANERQKSTAKKPAKKLSPKQREAKKKRKLIIFGAEVFIILIMVGVLYFVVKHTDNEHAPNVDPNFHDREPEEMGIPQQMITQKTDEEGSTRGYMNIALFGVDAQNEKQLYKDSRSDSIMIASINLDTGDIKLVSVYRDTYLNRGNDTYDKCNGAYSTGGAERAVKMLNMNLDLDIMDFVTVGYAGLAEVIDGLGGVWIDVDDQELKYINDYQYSILGKQAAKYISVPTELNFAPDEYFNDYDLKIVNKPGYQLLDGLQATAYCRIRYVGNDFQRTERQREVIKAIETQAKQADLATLSKVFESAADDIYTSLTVDTIIGELLPHIAEYRIVDEGAFPGINMRESVSMGAKGICEVPVDLEQSVVDLHEFLFDDSSYQVSDTVKNIQNKIEADASKYRGN